MESVIDQIKDKIDLIDLVQDYIRLQKSGANFKALCPFHREKTPSFFVSPERQIWHCFGCGAGGDHFKFLMGIEGVDFSEALRILARKAGVELKKFDKHLQGEKNKLYEICELASRFFEKQLYESEKGKVALNYLKDRGLSMESIKEWRLGYAPNSWHSLDLFLKNAGYGENEVFNAGLIVKREIEGISGFNESQNFVSEGVYDRFRGRIIFPIFDLNGQIVGFSGRIFDEQMVSGENTEVPAKYINTPQTPIYDKSKILYGLDRAKMEIKKSDRAIVVEGNFDLILSHQAGVKNVVATSGTALTDKHLKILKRYTENLDLCFDADKAGEIAFEKGWLLSLQAGFNVGIININSENLEAERQDRKIPIIKDVADLVKVNSSKWQEISQKSKPIMEFFIEKEILKNDPTTALGKRNIAKMILPKIKLIANKIEQAHWISVLSDKLNIGDKILMDAMGSIKLNQSAQIYNLEDIEKRIVPERPLKIMLEETLIALLFIRPDLIKKLEFDNHLKDMINLELHRRFFDYLVNTEGQNYDQFLNNLSNDEKVELEIIRFKGEQIFSGLKDEELEEEFIKIYNKFKKELIIDQIKNLEHRINLVLQNDQNKDNTELNVLLKEISELSRKLI